MPQQEPLLDRLVSYIEAHRGEPSSLIQVLSHVQQTVGYLPKPVLVEVADKLGLSLTEVYGTASFYAFFTFRPRGRHGIALCNGTACYVKGSAAVKVRLEQELGIKAGDTTPDRRFSLDVVRCIGCCALAPVMTVDEDVHAGVEPEKVPEILEQYK
ncbi:NADH-quinone oxidoreductase subunit NuoE [Candidatus Desulforudis audaxviator]|uniref:NADH dehydrogenase (Ubiquinone), 24 kDa subunit n=1 Tax=Desulforudis audaxviator (strain MP104C) TaxID=477974 RepID=B1I4K0_DESAP|nr:NADH-quinone oxidoreductase subunit NuoE [Candidatus Desulforudis audaxviator]ACA59848.1 NADH dehydrogenase (ubiquinone), 24 kDa subunit [Candidatus Desulforudis audaxviator MP104C]AZK59853.1 NADH-quinone oxidoreductase NuoE-like domain [Candidatus Desulforudis audaxviator]